jgi:hypothetical protein
MTLALHIKKKIKYIFFIFIRFFDSKIFIGKILTSSKNNNLKIKKKKTLIKDNVYSIDAQNTIVQCKENICIKKIKCYYSSKYRALFDVSGEKISSCSSAIRWADVPSKIHINHSAEIIEENLTFVGDIEMWHYGHFLIEGLAHIWVALLGEQQNRFFYLGEILSFKNYFLRKKNSYLDFCMNQVGLKRNNFVFLDRDAFLNNLYIPDPTFIIDLKAFEKHASFFKQIYINVSNGKSENRKKTIYLSRRNFKSKSRNIINEIELEKKLKTLNIDTIYPESLKLSEQILLFNSYENIIACFGSAIHTALFSFNPGLKMFILIAENTNLKTAKIIDSLTKTKTFYIPALKNIESISQCDYLKNKYIDIEHAVMKLIEYKTI